MLRRTDAKVENGQSIRGIQNFIDIRSENRYNSFKSIFEELKMFQNLTFQSFGAVLFIAGCLIPIALAENAMENSNALKVGMVAPGFTLKDEKGTERHLSEFLGKKNVVLAFYPKDFTGG